jgi:hypothetical protein
MVFNTITLEILAANRFKANKIFSFFGFTEKKWDSVPSVMEICGFNTGNAEGTPCIGLTLVQNRALGRGIVFDSLLVFSIVKGYYTL